MTWNGCGCKTLEEFLFSPCWWQSQETLFQVNRGVPCPHAVRERHHKELRCLRWKINDDSEEVIYIYFFLNQRLCIAVAWFLLGPCFVLLGIWSGWDFRVLSNRVRILWLNSQKSEKSWLFVTQRWSFVFSCTHRGALCFPDDDLGISGSNCCIHQIQRTARQISFWLKSCGWRVSKRTRLPNAHTLPQSWQHFYLFLSNYVSNIGTHVWQQIETNMLCSFIVGSWF